MHLPTTKIAHNKSFQLNLRSVLTWDTANYIKLFSFSFTARAQDHGHLCIEACGIWFVYIFYWQQFIDTQGLFSLYLSVYILDGRQNGHHNSLFDISKD